MQREGQLEEREGHLAKEALRMDISRPQNKKPDQQQEKFAPKLNYGEVSTVQAASHLLQLQELVISITTGL